MNKLIDAEGCMTMKTLSQNSRVDELANLPYKDGYIAKGNVHTLLDEVFFSAPCRPTFGRCRRSTCME